MFDFTFYPYIDQRPVYCIDFDNSKYSSYKCRNNEHVFTVEQGTQFYLKLHLTANPMPTYETLYYNDEEVPYTPDGTIYTGVDYMRIDSVIQSDAGPYKISTRNWMGEGSMSFRLDIQGKFHPSICLS